MRHFPAELGDGIADLVVREGNDNPAPLLQMPPYMGDDDSKKGQLSNLTCCHESWATI